MQPNIFLKIYFLKIFLVPYAFTGCNLRVGKINVSAYNMIIFASIVHQAQVNEQQKRIRRSQLVPAHIVGPQYNVNENPSNVKPHSHCADVATVHPDAGQPVYRDAPGHIS